MSNSSLGMIRSPISLLSELKVRSPPSANLWVCVFGAPPKCWLLLVSPTPIAKPVTYSALGPSLTRLSVAGALPFRVSEGSAHPSTPSPARLQTKVPRRETHCTSAASKKRARHLPRCFLFNDLDPRNECFVWFPS